MQEIEKEPLNSLSSIKRVVAIASGKGGVGKSLVTGLLALEARRKGYEVGIMDADITGPSIPKMFGLNERLVSDEGGIQPALTKEGIKIVSINLFLDNQESPVIWRGPLIAGTVKQFWKDTEWGELDYLFVDMPPGTGDVPLTVFQSLPVDGVVIVATPQDLVGLIVKKACNMATTMSIPILGLVENMSYYTCPKCGEKLQVFGSRGLDSFARETGQKLLAQLPIDSELADLCDQGLLEKERKDYLVSAFSDIDRW